MSKRFLSIILCICICASSLTACGKEEEKPKKPKTEEADESDDKDEADEQNAVIDEATDEEDDFLEQNPYEVEWKAAYIDKLVELRPLLPEDPTMMGAFDTPYLYFIYDVDNDKVPEMIVEYGTCEADYNGKLFAFEDGKVVEKDEFSMGHTSLYTDPNENGIVFFWGHMGYASISRASLINGKLEFEELLSEELDPDSDDYYTNPSKVVSGSSYLPSSRITQNILVTDYETIMRNMVNVVKTTEEDDLIPNNIEEIVPDIIENNGKVFAVSADGFGGDLGPNTEFTYFCMHLDDWTDSTYQVEDSAYLDVNGDKQLECVLKLMDKSTDYPQTKWVVVSSQDGMTYAYVINYSNDYQLLENGTFTSPNDEYYFSFRIAFDHDMCMTYEVCKDDVHAVILE